MTKKTYAEMTPEERLAHEAACRSSDDVSQWPKARDKTDHEFVLGHAFWNPYAEGDRCQFYQFPHGHCGAPRAMHERHAFTHYCGDEMCMDPTECSVCGLPRSAHTTPPRSELADQLEALMREANLKLPLKLVPGEFEHSGHPEEGPCDSDCYWVSPPGVNEIFTEDLGEYHGLSMASAALIVALVNALPEILTALRRTR